MEFIIEISPFKIKNTTTVNAHEDSLLFLFQQIRYDKIVDKKVIRQLILIASN